MTASLVIPLYGVAVCGLRYPSMEALQAFVFSDMPLRFWDWLIWISSLVFFLWSLVFLTLLSQKLWLQTQKCFSFSSGVNIQTWLTHTNGSQNSLAFHLVLRCQTPQLLQFLWNIGCGDSTHWSVIHLWLEFTCKARLNCVNSIPNILGTLGMHNYLQGPWNNLVSQLLMSPLCSEPYRRRGPI